MHLTGAFEWSKSAKNSSCADNPCIWVLRKGNLYRILIRSSKTIKGEYGTTHEQLNFVFHIAASLHNLCTVDLLIPNDFAIDPYPLCPLLIFLISSS